MFLLDVLKNPSPTELDIPHWRQLRTKLESLGPSSLGAPQEHLYYNISHPVLMRQLEDYIGDNTHFDSFLYDEHEKDKVGHVTIYPTYQRFSFDIPWDKTTTRTSKSRHKSLTSRDQFAILSQAVDFMLLGGTAAEILETQDVIRKKLYGDIENRCPRIRYFENRKEDRYGKSHIIGKGYCYDFNQEQTQQLNLAMQNRGVMDDGEILKDIYMRVPVDIYHNYYDGYIDLVAKLDFPEITSNLEGNLALPIFHFLAKTTSAPYKPEVRYDSLANVRNYKSSIFLLNENDSPQTNAVNRRLKEFDSHLGGASPITPQILGVIANEIL